MNTQMTDDEKWKKIAEIVLNGGELILGKNIYKQLKEKAGSSESWHFSINGATVTESSMIGENEIIAVDRQKFTMGLESHNREHNSGN